MTQMTAEQAMKLALQEEMLSDQRVLLMGEGVATKHHDLVQEFGSMRIRNTPLAEAIIAGTAVGAAASGLRPVIDMLFAPFLTYSMDALINSAGKLRFMSGGQFEFPLVALALTGTGWCVGAQHNHNLEAMFVQAPGLKVVMPSQPTDFRALLRAAIRDPNPVLFFTDIGLLYQPGEVPEVLASVEPLGRAAIRRKGSDITLVSYAKTVSVSLEAAAQLSNEGIDAEVIDLRCLKPLDKETVLTSVQKTGRLIIVHEAAGPCGVGAELSAIAAAEAFNALRAPVLRLTGPDAPVGASAVLERAVVPQPQTVVQVVRRLLDGPRFRTTARPAATAVA